VFESLIIAHVEKSSYGYDVIESYMVQKGVPVKSNIAAEF
jgi:hypothetical protein